MQFSHLTFFLVCFIQLEAGAAREQAREAERQAVEACRLQREREVEAAEGAARAAEERRVAEETRKRLRVEERVREKELRRDALAREERIDGSEAGHADKALAEAMAELCDAPIKIVGCGRVVQHI